MRALVCRELTPDLSGLRVESSPVPVPGEGEVLIEVEAAALNFPDYLMTQGLYQHKPDLPFVPGLEGAGVVAEIGSGVTSCQVGDRVVFGAVGLNRGAMATHSLATADSLRPVPDDLSSEEAAAFRTAFATAWAGLVERGDLKKEETLLVHGATGGVGMAAVMLGKHLGAKVIATGSSPDKLALAKSWGAHHTVLSEAGFYKKVREWTDNKGADVIYDPVGGDVFDESTRCIAWGGRIVVVGFASGRIPQIGVNIPLIKGFSVVGLRAGEMGRRNPAMHKRIEEAIWKLPKAGLRPHIGARYSLDDAIQAFRDIGERKILGKTVISPMSTGASPVL